MKKLPALTLFLATVVCAAGCGPAHRLRDNTTDIAFEPGKRYLLIPIDDEAPEREMYLVRNGAAVGPRMSIRLADGKISYRIPVPADGSTDEGGLALRIVGAEENDPRIDAIKASDDFYFDAAEKFRPRYHFTPRYGWMNDPNGMVWHNGEYHLFYQHNPYGSVWGNMHWGHAVSKDLIKWEHLPVAIAPDSLGTIFSGSAVVDTRGSAGFGENALVAIYTSAGERQTQSIAYSRDGGRSFSKYAANPVLTALDTPDFRDPKVFWHEGSRRWVMTLATGQTVSFYVSSDLKSWKRSGGFGEGIGAHGGVWECPDLFPLPWEGAEKWVLIVNINPGGPNGGSAAQYFIGDFDGRTFHADPLPYPLWLDHGRDNYAGVTWNGAPGGRRIFIGWMSNWEYANAVPTLHFKSASTLPRELRLVRGDGHPVVASAPVKEVDLLRGERIPLSDIEADKTYTVEKLLENNNGAFEIEMTIKRGRSARLAFALSNRMKEELKFTFDFAGGELRVDRSRSGESGFSDRFAATPIVAPLADKSAYRIRLFLDRASSELFVDGGELVSTNIIFPTEPYNTLSLESDGRIGVEDISVYRIN